MLDDRIELLHELFVAVTDAVQVSAEAGYALREPTGFLDLLVIHSIQRKLRCVKGHSILTVNSRSRAKGN